MGLRDLPLPLADLDTQAFWDGCQRGELQVPCCSACADTFWPPGPMCPSCQSLDIEWLRATGRGSVYTWTVVVHPVDPVLVDQVPYVVALVELPEGVRMIANIEDCPPDQIRAGMEVELCFYEREDGTPLPNFRRTLDTR